MVSLAPYLAALGQVLDVTVATVFTPRNGPSRFLGSLLKLWAALLQVTQQSSLGFWQIGCNKHSAVLYSAVPSQSQCSLGVTDVTMLIARNGCRRLLKTLVIFGATLLEVAQQSALGLWQVVCSEYNALLYGVASSQSRCSLGVTAAV